MGWDLAIIDDVKEHKDLNSKLGGCIPYWLGMTNPTGSKLIDHDGNDVLFAMWDTHLGHHVNPVEPNDQMGSETCVRMRGGMYNDALCNDSNGFNKKECRGTFVNIIIFLLHHHHQDQKTVSNVTTTPVPDMVKLLHGIHTADVTNLE